VGPLSRGYGITGNISDPISIVFYATEQNTTTTGTLHVTSTKTQGTYDPGTKETVGIRTNADIPVVYTISIGVLAAALIICVVVSITVITIILRSKTKITATVAQLDRAEERESDEPMYDNVTGPLSPVSTVTTRDNVAYHHIQKRLH
jgi:hypothetical protein